jgi:hypothetical protein
LSALALQAVLADLRQDGFFLSHCGTLSQFCCAEFDKPQINLLSHVPK